MKEEEDAKKRIKKLKETINHHRYLYHVMGKEEISSEALDSLKKELFDLESKFPHLVTPDSPTQRVEGKPLDEFEKARHYRSMLSFQDAFSKEDMLEFEKRITRITPENFTYFCELKVDGLAVELTYEDNVLVRGATRGDGRVGEDVTQNLKTIEAIPLRIFSEEKRSVVVRGEVFISKKEFERLNKERRKEGLALYANPRNIAAGSIRQLDPKIAASRNLDFFAYDIVADTDTGEVVEPFGAKTHKEKHILLREMGFKTVDREAECSNLGEVFVFHKKAGEERERYTYQIDGIAVFVNENRVFEDLGVAGKAPRGGIAYKFPLEETTTKIEDVHFQVGRTGAVTPVAVLNPVDLGGVTVSRATLHNEDEIKRLGVKKKDTVVVGRAGDVIPRVVRALPELRSGDEKEISFPKECPLCKSRLVRPEGEARWYCRDKNCRGTRKERLRHLVSKNGFDIAGFGEKGVNRLMEEGIISDPADIFFLQEGDLLPLERFAEKSVHNLLKAIEDKKRVPLSKFLQALSIPFVGEATARELSYHFGSLERIESASLEEISSVHDIGPVTAKSIYDFFREKKNKEFLEKLKKAGVSIEKEERSRRLEGKVFVITGTLQDLKREEAEKKIVGAGGRVSSSVSVNTDYLVAGENPGTKLERAKEMGVKILTREEFLQMVE